MNVTNSCPHQDWEEQARRGRNHAILFIDVVARGVNSDHVGEFLQVPFRFTHYRQFAAARWFLSSEIAAYVQLLKDEEAHHPGYLLGLANAQYAVTADAVDWAQTQLGRDFSSASNDELIDVLRGWANRFEPIFAACYTYTFLNRFYPDVLVEIVSRHEPDFKRQQEDLQALFALDEPSETRQEQESILIIAQAALETGGNDNDARIQRLIETHVRRFAHLGLYYFYREPYTAAQIRERVNELLGKDLSAEREKINASKTYVDKSREIMNRLGFTADERLVVETIKRWAFVANDFDEQTMRIVYLLWDFWHALADRLSISYAQLVEMTVSEVEGALRAGRVSEELKRELSDRYEDSALVLDEHGVHVFVGEPLQAYYRENAARAESYEHVRELRGQPASPGLVRGTVRVLNSIHELHKVKKGDILVAAATTPGFVPAMEKAAAIVTNEGGLLCHAAIVSRELQIPCVVGTKIATKALKDGETVEVDANKGIVHKV